MYSVHDMTYDGLKSYVMTNINSLDHEYEMVYILMILKLIQSDIESDTRYINENILNNIMKEPPSDLINNIKENSDMLKCELLNIIKSPKGDLSVYLIGSDTLETKTELEDAILEFLYLEYDN